MRCVPHSLELVYMLHVYMVHVYMVNACYTANELVYMVHVYMVHTCYTANECNECTARSLSAKVATH